jgi:hypothetical protein
MDLEFGQIFGSFRRDFVPIEAGMLISNYDGDVLDIRDSEFDFDGDLVLRKNSIDSLGNPIGIEEMVMNPSRNISTEFDPRYRVSREIRHIISKKAETVFMELRQFCQEILSEYELDSLVFFGAQEDLNLLNRAGFDTSALRIRDIQRELRKEIGQDFSLDKASLVIGYGSDEGHIYSNHFRYTIPDEYIDRLDPHMAVGDVARIFLLHREFLVHRDDLLDSARELLGRIEDYRNSDEEIPIF